MIRTRSMPLALAGAVVGLQGLGAAHAEEAPETAANMLISQVVVHGRRAIAGNAATGLELTIRETPQSVSVVPRTRIDDFGLDNVNDVLQTVTGVTVEKVETDRAYYTARGFDITSFQVDGVGVPFQFGNVEGDIDTALYQRVEIVRGADGLLTGTGNPSATINYVRKRPTPAFQASAAATVGSWDRKRLSGDVSGPLNASGTLLGRLVVAGEDKDSWLDRYHAGKIAFYGVLEAHLTPKAVLTVGYSQQDNHATNILWGALPLSYSDGTQTDFPVSTSTSADWTYWDTHDKTAFAEFAYALSDRWTLKTTLTYNRIHEPSKLYYVFGAPDPQTGLGLAGSPLRYEYSASEYIGDVRLSGSYDLFGRSHEIVAGVSLSRADNHETSFNASDGAGPLPVPLEQWNGVMPEPHFDAPITGGDFTDRLNRAYVSTRLDIADPFKLILGANFISDKETGVDYGADMSKDVSKLSPYVGAVLDLGRNVSLYASYSDIFHPQNEIDAAARTLDPATGKSYEAGVKSEWLGGRAYANAAVFKSEQLGLANFAGNFPDGRSYYVGQDTFAKGFEVEVGGRAVDGLDLSAGFTHLSVEDAAGADTRLYIPRNQAKLSVTYSPPALSRLKLGANLRWQDEISTDTGFGTARQKAYAVADLMASWRLDDHLTAQINLYNVGDAKYLSSLYWTQAWYGQPRSVSASLKWTY